MADLKRRVETLRAERDRLRQELDDHRAVHGWIDPEYAATLRVLVHLAGNGLRRPDDLGGPIATIRSASIAPAYSEWAYDQLRNERRNQRKRTADLRAKVRARFNNGHAEEAPDTDDEKGHSVQAPRKAEMA